MRILSFVWNANPEPDIAGYKFHVGRHSGPPYDVPGSPISVGNVTTYTYIADPDGPWYFALTAINTSGLESFFSAEVLVDTTPGVARWVALVGRG